MKTNRAFLGVLAASLCIAFSLTLTCALLSMPASLAAQQSKEIEKKLKNRSLHWSPPLVDTPIRSRVSSPPCVLSSLLELAGARANDLVLNLQNFTSQEYIAYQSTDRLGYVQDGGTGTFDYVVVFQQSLGGLVVQEDRKPAHGTRLSAATTQDVGLAEIALIFLPDMQGDYEISCEGTTKWDGQSTWVVHFQQRKDKPSRTLSFRGGGSVYPAKLKGRAWIAADSGEVVHMETSLMEEIPAASVRHWYLSINYAPVQFRTRNVRLWLPQTVDAYCDFEDRRTIVYHTFTNFLLFSVQTDQKIEKPKEP